MSQGDEIRSQRRLATSQSHSSGYLRITINLERSSLFLLDLLYTSHIGQKGLSQSSAPTLPSLILAVDISYHTTVRQSERGIREASHSMTQASETA